MEPSTQPIVIALTYHAPIAKVWSALTNANQMREWYFDLPDFKPEAGFQFSFLGGPPDKQYNHICQVTRAVTGKLIAHTWQYEGYTGNSEVSWELFEMADETRVVLTHTGLHTLPAEPDFARSNFEAGWTHITQTGLKSYLDKHN